IIKTGDIEELLQTIIIVHKFVYRRILCCNSSSLLEYGSKR
ncbi:26404_t:CDS:1, partial [Dentiscutata erythropus]